MRKSKKEWEKVKWVRKSKISEKKLLFLTDFTFSHSFCWTPDFDKVTPKVYQTNVNFRRKYHLWYKKMTFSTPLHPGTREEKWCQDPREIREWKNSLLFSIKEIYFVECFWNISDHKWTPNFPKPSHKALLSRTEEQVKLQI